MPIGVSKSEHYGSFGDLLLDFEPIEKIVASPEFIPIFIFGKFFERTSEPIPMTGPYIYGHLKGIPIWVDSEWEKKLIIYRADGEHVEIQLEYKEIEPDGSRS